MPTALEFVASMGLGWNLGNTFDAFPLEGERDRALAEGRGWTPADQQRLWNNVPVDADQIARVKAAGFDTVRIPVTWRDWIDADGAVAEEWMVAVEQAVDWALAAGLKVILNVHHDGSDGETLWLRRAGRDWEGVSRRFAGLWRAIATRFADRDERLVLEGSNELDFPGVDEDAQYALLLRLNQLFVDTVRSCGEHNESRFLLIPGMNTDTARTCDSRFVMPADSVPDRLIVSIHYYSPARFTLATHDVTWCGSPQYEWGSREEVAAVEADFALQRAWFVDRGIPVIIGEYAVLTEEADGKDHASNLRWLDTVTRCALANGSCPVLWDTSTKEMNFLDRQTGCFYDAEVASLFARLRPLG